MAELVPNCSHVLHFSDEEVEYLQKIVAKYEAKTYKSYFREELDPGVFEKYPPRDLSKSRNSSIEIHLDEEIILDKFRMFHVHAEDGTEFSRTYHFFSYVLLLAWYEKLSFRSFEFHVHDYYGIIFCLYRMIRIFRNETVSESFFPFLNKTTPPNINEADKIFKPIQVLDQNWESVNYPTKKHTCCIQ